MKRKLTTVEITKLNFYPEHFLDTLKAMGFDTKNKKLTDSIYYSFSGYCKFGDYDSPINYETETESAYSFDEALSVTKQKTDRVVVADSIEIVDIYHREYNDQDGHG